MQAIELWIGRLGAIAASIVLALALIRLLGSGEEPTGRTVGRVTVVLRRPTLFLAAGLFILVGAVLWRPIPLVLAAPARLAALASGSVLLFGGLALYLWGLRALGSMFGSASGLAARLYEDHRLVVTGPYAWIRHPMYLGVMAAFFGGLLLYRTWALALYAPLMLGLVIRARREEEALVAEFGDEWQRYRRRVPAWIPRLRR